MTRSINYFAWCLRCRVLTNSRTATSESTAARLSRKINTTGPLLSPPLKHSGSKNYVHNAAIQTTVGDTVEQEEEIWKSIYIKWSPSGKTERVLNCSLAAPSRVNRHSRTGRRKEKCRHLWCLSSLCSVVQPWYVVPFHLTAGYGQLLRRREITSFHFLSTREIKKRTARRRVQVLTTMSPVNWPTRKKQGRAGVRGYNLFLLSLASKHTADDWRYRYDPETVPHINKHGGSTCVSKLRGHTRKKKSQCGVMGSHPRGQPTLSLCCVVSGRNAPFFLSPPTS